MAVNGIATVDVEGQTYRLVFGINALVALEESLDLKIDQLAAALGGQDGVSFKLLREVFWASLQEHHEGITKMEAGSLMTAIGGIDKSSALIMKAFKAAFPQVEEGEANAHPRKPGRAAGTGKTSSRAGAN